MAADGGNDGGGDAFAAPLRGTFRAVPADRKVFRLVRKQTWEAEVQRRFPAALRSRRGRAAVEDGAAGEGGGRRTGKLSQFLRKVQSSTGK